MFWAIIDLPTPFGPRSTALLASLMKSSPISPSMAARSQRLGQDQSKSQSGLKLPIRASLRRRSRLRRRRSYSSQSSSLESQSVAATSFQCASRPCRCRASARLRSASGSVMGGVLELIVGVQGMRAHRRIAVLGAGRQRGGDRRRLATGLTPALEGEANGIGVRHAAVERLADGDLQFGSAVALKEAGQADGDGAEIAAAFG